MFIFRRLFRAGKEFRKSERISTEDLLKVDFQAANVRRITGLGSVKNISLGGMKFATYAPLKKGDDLDAVLIFCKEFSGAQRIPVQLRVVHVYRRLGSKRYRVGVIFQKSPKYQREMEIIRVFMQWVKTL